MSDTDNTSPRIVDARTFWQAAGLRATGAAIVTAQAGDGPRGFYALSATHLSADPPLMMISVDEKTSALSTIVEAGHFAINYLAAGQADLVSAFSGKSALTGAERFTVAGWKMLSTGAPVLIDGVGTVDCLVEDIIRREGSAIVIGRVAAFEASDSGAPMITYRGKTL